MGGTTTLKNFVRRFVRIEKIFSIAIYTGKDIYSLSPHAEHNPILTKDSIHDVSAMSVADPFMIHRHDGWYMFFEVEDKIRRKASIGLAYSTDAIDWQYRQIILSEPFHLSYPYVFEWQDDVFMVPETGHAQSVRLYRAKEFPTVWQLEAELLTGLSYVDSSPFFFDGRWWLFTALSDTYDLLLLYYSDCLTGPWIQHPKSPIVKGNRRIARPAGRVQVMNGSSVVRFAQDCYSDYGKKVRAFKINKLTTENYEEEEVATSPILNPGAYWWNVKGMHHIDAHQISSDYWLACVDGKRHKITFFDRRAIHESECCEEEVVPGESRVMGSAEA
jgi:hypothetical protein